MSSPAASLRVGVRIDLNAEEDARLQETEDGYRSEKRARAC